MSEDVPGRETGTDDSVPRLQQLRSRADVVPRHPGGANEHARPNGAATLASAVRASWSRADTEL